MRNMPGGSFAFGKPTLAEISLKMSNACVEWDSCAVCLMTSEAAEMAEKRRYILSAVTWGRRRITYMYKMPGTGLGFDQPTLAEISLKMSIVCDE